MNIELMKANLHAQILPAALVVSNFVVGMEQYSYEDYLLDVVNSSNHFRELSGGKTYDHPDEEAHGECDCISDNYQLDFKLIASQTAMQGKNLLDPQITRTAYGTLYYGSKIDSSNPKYKPIQATRIFAAIRGLSQEDLYGIQHQKDDLSSVQKDVKRLLTTLDTPKNLFLFFPYNFYFDIHVQENEGLKYILYAVSNDFRSVLSYRNMTYPELDSYFCFLYSNQFVIARWQDDSLQYIESVSTAASALFLNLYRCCDDMF